MNLLDYLDIRIETTTPDKVILTMSVLDQHKQPFGLLHGGLNGVLIETACNIGANHNLPEEAKYAVGIDLQVNHLKPVQSGIITVTATPIHIGRTTQVWEASIYHNDSLTSVGRCTMMNQ